jgi:hypothetical protein
VQPALDEDGYPTKPYAEVPGLFQADTTYSPSNAAGWTLNGYCGPSPSSAKSTGRPEATQK